MKTSSIKIENSVTETDSLREKYELLAIWWNAPFPKKQKFLPKWNVSFQNELTALSETELFVFHFTVHVYF